MTPDMRSRTLLTSVLTVNVGLVALTAGVAAVVARERFDDTAAGRGVLLIALAVCGAVLLNSIVLRHLLAPVARLACAMDAVDLHKPRTVRASVRRTDPAEVAALSRGFNRMLDRIETERRDAGRAVLRAQEEERRGIAQDLHDEVNQALTAILLRLSATMSTAHEGVREELEETRGLVQHAMDELLVLARALRPTALDDHGLVAALASQVRDFGDRTGIQARFRRHGTMPPLSAEEQLVVYRVTQESLSNVVKHANATSVDVELSFIGRTVLRVTDNGVGIGTPSRDGRPRHRTGGLGLSGMRERALLVGGTLAIYSQPGNGTTIELTMEGS
jgi:two-component system, NarL family, sensor histidine kinase UhpB